MAQEIGETVIQLLENGKRVTTGNIIDLLERKSHALHGQEADEIREILILSGKNLFCKRVVNHLRCSRIMVSQSKTY